MVGQMAPGGAEVPEDVAALLSRSGGFVLCDAKACPKVKGLPVRFASETFLDTFGYSDASECVGQALNAVLTGNANKGHPGLCLAAAQAAGIPSYMASEAIDSLASHFCEVTKRLSTTSPSSCRSATVLTLARESSGRLFVCELTMSVNQHPSLGWAYVVGMHQDVTEEISVAALLAAAASADVCAGRENLASALGVDLGHERTGKNLEILNGSNIIGFLNARAAEMWQTLVADMMRGPGNPDEKPQKASRRLIAKSVASGSTAASRRSAKSRLSTASADTEWDWGASRALQEQTLPAGCHLGALLGAGGFTPAKAGAPSNSGAIAGLQLDIAGIGSGEDAAAKAHCGSLAEEPTADFKQPHGPTSPTTPTVLALNSTDLQKVIETMGKKELQDLDFPFMMVDPSKPGCPLVVFSAGFSGLTGYSSSEALGRDCMFQSRGVPNHLVCEEQCDRVSDFLKHAACHKYYPGRVPEDFSSNCNYMLDEVCNLAEGELVTVQTHARRSGELFRCMTILKQVELEDEMFVIGVEARIPDPTIDPEEHHDESAEEKPESRLLLAFHSLSKHMDVAIHVLAAQFWYSAPMRRQSAVSSESEFERD